MYHLHLAQFFHEDLFMKIFHKFCAYSSLLKAGAQYVAAEPSLIIVAPKCPGGFCGGSGGFKQTFLPHLDPNYFVFMTKKKKKKKKKKIIIIFCRRREY